MPGEGSTRSCLLHDQFGAEKIERNVAQQRGQGTGRARALADQPGRVVPRLPPERHLEPRPTSTDRQSRNWRDSDRMQFILVLSHYLTPTTITSCEHLLTELLGVEAG